VTPLEVLWVTTEASPAPRAGGGLRSLRLVQAVAREHAVHVVNIGLPFAEEEYCRVSGASSAQGVAPQPAPRERRLVRALVSRAPLGPSRLSSSVVADLVRRTARAGGLVVFEHTVTLSALPREVRYVVALQNVDSEVLGELGRPTRALRRLQMDYERWATARVERRLVADPRALVVAVSDRDARLLGGDVEVVPNGADLPRAVSPVPAQGPVAFLASMGYPPNEDAVRWWASAVHPLGDLPPLTVAGLGSLGVLHDLAGDPSVELVGELDVVDPWLARARMVALPLRAGGGTRLKLIEAMAHGRPVVSTTKGAEGFPVRHGEHLLLADSPEDFAAAVRRVLTDDALAASLADAGRAFAMSYAWPALGRRFVQLLREHHRAA
jgi:glycosyltransferase involved in cell wall biosynthesis